jgi:hypothetical protein
MFRPFGAGISINRDLEISLHGIGIRRAWFLHNRVVQKLQFLNNNRLKKKKNMGFLRKSMFFARLVQ